MRVLCLVAVMWLAVVPTFASAQQTTGGVIAGQVHDATGAVLPGVTVEVASPALIEKVRSVVTGNDGLYRVVDLRPGVYSVTFTLGGFGKLVREDVQLTSGFTATINAELKVGDLEEAITVSGASPVVDLQNVTKQSVLSGEVLEEIPSGRIFSVVGKLVPGIDSSGAQGMNSAVVGRDGAKLSYQGSGTVDFRITLDGMPQIMWVSDGIGVPAADNIAEEVNLQYSALPAEVETGGVQYNLIPKTGSNTFRTSIFGNFGTSGMQSDNITDALRAQGLTAGSNIDYVTEFTPSFGGPIVRDRVWFFATHRDYRPYLFSTVLYDVNKTDYVYTPDTSRDPAIKGLPQRNTNARLTWQATPRNKLSLGVEFSKVTSKNHFIGSEGGAAVNAAEATNVAHITYEPVVQLSWTAPLNNRLLLDVGGQIFRGAWDNIPQPDISVGPAATELSTNINFRASTGSASLGPAHNPYFHDFLRGAVSYTKGAHAIKVGGSLWHAGMESNFQLGRYGFVPYSIALLSGAPARVTYLVDPNTHKSRFLNTAVYAQDQWTVRRLTLNYGARIDTHDAGVPDQQLEPTAYIGARSFPEAKVIRWRDWSPRLGVAYDLFGNGKTAVKASFSRYVVWDSVGFTDRVNPANLSGQSLTRTWNDRLACPTCISGDFIPQGDPTNPLVNGELGPSPNATWGTPRLPARYDPEWAQGGWGKRGYNWERSISVQHELVPNVSVGAGFMYRSYGNFTITDNAAVGRSDFDTFCITAPRDSRLPGGGGNQICGLYDVKPAAVSLVDNFTTRANEGDIKQNFKGIDTSLRLRLPKTLVQGGVTWGRELYDICQVTARVPELLISGTTKIPADQCRQVQPYLAQVKFLATYELPWALSLAGTYQNSNNSGAAATNFGFGFGSGAPRMGISASYLATNATIAPALGRNLSAGPNATANVNLVTPGTLWGDRIQSIDLRVARTFRISRVSLKGMVDAYNVTNANTSFVLNQTYGTNGAIWLQPLQILAPRLVKLGIQVDF